MDDFNWTYLGLQVLLCGHILHKNFRTNALKLYNYYRYIFSRFLNLVWFGDLVY